MELTSRAVSTQRAIPTWLPWTVVAVICLRVIASFVPESKAESLVRWVALSEARPRAAASGKLIMYDFSAAWCGPCRVLEREVFSHAPTAKNINGSVIPVHVVDRTREDGRNSPEIEALQKKYDIRAFPTIVLAEANGKSIARMEGFQGRPAFEKLLTAATPYAPFAKR